MRTVLTILIFLLAGSVFAQRNARPITADSLPVELDKDDSVYFDPAPDTVWLAGNTSDGYASINFGGHYAVAAFKDGDTNAFFDGGSTVFVFDTNGIATSSDCQIAIWINGDCPGAVVYGGTYVTQDTSTTVSDVDPTRIAIQLQTVSDVLIDSCTIDMNGYQVLGMYGENLYRDTVRDVRIYNRSWRYSDRQYYNNEGVSFWQHSARADSAGYNVILDHVVVEETHHAGIDISRNRPHLYDCTVYTAARNVIWDTAACWPGGCNTGESEENSYGLSATHLKPGSLIDGLHISPKSGVGGRGGRFAMIQDCIGTSDSEVVFRNMTGWAYQGPSGEDAGGSGRGIRVRDDLDLWDYVKLVACTVRVKADTSTATTDIGTGAYPLEVTVDEDSEGYGHLTIDSCLFAGYALTNDVTVTGGRIGQSDAVAQGRHIQVKNSTFLSSDISFQFVEPNSVAGSNLDLINCTFGFFDSTTTDTFIDQKPVLDDPVTFNLTGLYLGGAGNKVIDGTFIEDATDTNITMTAHGSEKSLALQRILDVTVTDANDNECEGCSVYVWNAYAADTTGRSGTVMSGTTTTGVASDTVTHWYEARDGSDSTAFNDFRVKAIAPDGSDSVSTTYTVTDSTDTPSIQLTSYSSGAATVESKVRGNVAGGKIQ